MSAPTYLTCSCGDSNDTVEMRNTEDGYMEMCHDCYTKYQARKMAEYADDDAIAETPKPQATAGKLSEPMVKPQVTLDNPIINQRSGPVKKVVKKPMPSTDMGVFHYHTIPNPAMPWTDLEPEFGKLEKCYDINGKEMELFAVYFGNPTEDWANGVNGYKYLGYFSSIGVNTIYARTEACKRLMYHHHHPGHCRKCRNKNRIVNDRPEGMRNNWHRFCDDYIKTYDQLETDLKYYTLDIEPILGSSGLLKFIKDELYIHTAGSLRTQDRRMYCASRLIHTTPYDAIELRKRIETAIGKFFQWDDFRLVCEYYCQILTQNSTEFDFLL